MRANGGEADSAVGGPAPAWWQRPGRAWGLAAVVLTLTSRISGYGPDDHPTSVSLATFSRAWRQFDGHAYLGIAAQGYWYEPGIRSPIVWFPGYPMAIRIGAQVVGDYQVAAYLVSLVAGLAVAVLLFRWLDIKGLTGAARAGASAALLLSPFAFFFYGALYPDALFVALVLGAFCSAERGRPVVAGLVAAAATAVRSNGVCLIPALLVIGLEQSGALTASPGATGLVARLGIPTRFDRTRLRPVLAAPLAGLAGIGAYATYLGIRFGEPFAFLTNQSLYHPDPADWRHREFVRQLSEWADRGWAEPRYPVAGIAQAIMVVAVLASVPLVGRRFGWGYGVFCGLIAAVPLLAVSDFVGSARYLLAAFPAFALLGEWLASRPTARWVALGCSSALLMWLTAGFARGWYLT